MNHPEAIVEPPVAVARDVRFRLDADEVRQVESVLGECTRRWSSVEDPELQAEICVLAHELPRRLRSFLKAFKLHEPQLGHCVVGGLPIDDEAIGNTPPHWNHRAEVSPALREEMFLVLVACLLGEPIAWATQQDGYLVHDVIPIESNKHSQLGTGSEELLWWHTEDAFHPFRGDYLGLLCLRNPDRVATTLGTLDGVELDPRRLEVLFQPRFTIRPDESHLAINASADHRTDDSFRASYERISMMNVLPDKVPVLLGDPRSPYMRLDPYFMDELVDDPEAQAALQWLVDTINDNLTEVVLQPGEIFIVDNYRAVHGRKAFHARYDGRDRWLKRVNIARDLRKSRTARSGSDQRAIY